MKHLAFVLILALAASVRAEPRATTPAGKETRLADLGTNAYDRVNLLDLGRKTLGSDAFKWRHGQTPHFVIHYENAIFAQKVARMAEFFYDYISGDLKMERDLVQGCSHIFIFNTKKDWLTFLATVPGGGMAWSQSFVSGPEMFLQQTGSGSDASDTLGHEMTHLVMNRFFTGHPPLAINEGVAEWYGEFATAAFKGVKKSRRQEFKKIARTMPLASLLQAQAYPATEEEIRPFYENAKNFVGFLMLRKPPEKFPPFLSDLTKGDPVFEALTRHYGFADAGAVEKEFVKFCR